MASVKKDQQHHLHIKFLLVCILGLSQASLGVSEGTVEKSNRQDTADLSRNLCNWVFEVGNQCEVELD